MTDSDKRKTIEREISIADEKIRSIMRSDSKLDLYKRGQMILVGVSGKIRS